MPTGTLLLRETASTSLTTIVEKSQHRKPPLPEYELRLVSGRLDLVLKPSKPDTYPKPTPADEGFESDVDSVSIVSSDDSYIPPPRVKTQETDSANGSASSDSDTETPYSVDNAVETATPAEELNESHHLVDCVCYADVKFPNLLVFVIKGEALVFRFNHLDDLHRFYVNFSALKAVANQKAYSASVGTKFNLLQRTDNNGVTHIEITREPEARLYVTEDREGPRGVSLKTPETTTVPRSLSRNSNVSNSRPVRTSKNELPSAYKSLTLSSVTKELAKPSRDANQRQRNDSLLIDDAARFRTLQSKIAEEMRHTRNARPKLSLLRSASIENLLNVDEISKPHDTIDKPLGSLRKVWNSAEDLLDSPKRPERRRKPKGRAPPPPTQQQAKEPTLQGQYIRMAEKPASAGITRIAGSGQNFAITTPKPSLSNMFSNAKAKLTTYQQFKSDTKKVSDTSTLSRHTKLFSENSWTNSVPRLLKKPRSRSETRNFTPMAYRYIDTTQNYNSSPYTGRQTAYFNNPPGSHTISNRLFGMSSKLKEFSAIQSANGRDSVDGRDGSCRWGSLGQLNYKFKKSDNSLKSVIKKDENKRKSNDKKVTFSAYTTVQVV